MKQKYLFKLLFLSYSIILLTSFSYANTTSPVCIESLEYGAAGKISACMDGPIFKGGAGCRETLKLRNLSDKPLKNARILTDYNLLNTSSFSKCGIDGIDKTGEDCNVTNDIEFGPFGVFNKAVVYDPVGNFDPYESHTIYTQGLTSSDWSFLKNNTYIEYTDTDGTIKTEKVAKCQIETTTDDLCIESTETIKEGFGLCVDFGNFFAFGAATGGCGKQINLKNQGYSNLTSVSARLVTNAMFDGDFLSKCSIDGEKSNSCHDHSVMDFGFMDMSGMFLGKTITYDPVPDFGTTPPTNRHNISNLSKINMAFFKKSKLMGTYIKDGKLYNGEIKACGGCIKIYFDKDHYDTKEDIDTIGTTKIVHPVIKLSRASDQDITVHYHTIDGTATVADGDYIKVDDALATIPAGETNTTISIQVYNDAPIELDEYFNVQLTDPHGACLNDRNTTKINILAQDDAPICFEDNFDNGLDSKWRVLSNPHAKNQYTPQVVNVNGDARLRLTDGTHDLATVITKDYEFDTRYNLIIVEFDYYNYGGCSDGNNYHQGKMGNWGADGIVNVLFNSNKLDGTPLDSPKPGAIGGSMGYAQMNIHENWGTVVQDGFEGGWLGLGLDEFGNFARANEGKVGGITPDDRTINAVTIRGDGNGLNGYEYLAGTTTLSPTLANELGTNYQPDGYFSGRYKFTVDARDPNHLYLRLERSLTGDPADYTTIIEQFDAKAPGLGQGITPEKVRYAITAGTGGGCNNHEISWIKLRGNCAAYGTHSSYATGPFDAWDTFRNVYDRNISTKISNQPFTLKLASLDETNHALEVKSTANRVYYGLVRRNPNTTGYSYVVDPLDNPALDFTVAESYNKQFNVNSAVADSRVVFRFCADYNGTTYTLYPPDTNCTGQPSIVLWPEEQNMVGWREFLSSDNFAIRPDHFTIDMNNTVVGAGNNFNVTLHAVDSSGNDVPDYNETVNIWGASPTLDHNESKTNCRTGTLTKVSGGFINGRANMTLSYDEVGRLKLLLTEHNSTDFAHVDLDDTDYNATTHDSSNHGGSIYRQIASSNTPRSFIPDHFELANIKLHDHHEANDINFTYLASQESVLGTHDTIEPSMAATLDLDIIAYTALNTTTVNYNNACYAQNINSLVISYEFNTTNPAETTPVGLTKILYRWFDDSSTANEGSGKQVFRNSIDIASASSIGKAVFNTDHNGTAKLKIQLNFDRSYNTPVNPFFFSIKDINVSDTNNIVDINNSAKPDHNATYLYARAKATKDFYEETSSPVNTPIKVEVYCGRWPASALTCPSVDIISGQTNNYAWWISTKHNMANQDGNITLKTPTAHAGLQPVNGVVTINLPQQGIDKNINVTSNGVFGLIDIDFDITNSTDTSLWLIHNKDSDKILSPFCQVNIVGTMDWAGHGDTGNVVESNASTHKNQRLGW